MDSQIKIFIHFENFLPNLIFLIDKNIQLFKHQSLKQFPLLSNIFFADVLKKMSSFRTVTKNVG
jgi:hypothetical protein